MHRSGFILQWHSPLDRAFHKPVIFLVFLALMQVERDHAMFRLDIIMASYTIIKPADPNYTQLTCD